MSWSWQRVSLLLQRYRSPLLLASCSGIFGLNLVQHLLPDQVFCSVYQAWSKGEPAELSPRLQELFKQVLSDVAVGSPQKFSAFASFGFQPVGAGLPVLPGGVKVGIPANFNSSESGSGAGITDRTIFVEGRAVDWSSGPGSALSSALVMSETAHRFALAREVVRLDAGLPLMTAAVGPLCVGGVWVYSVTIKHMFGLRSSPLLARAVNLVALALGGVSYLAASDAVARFVDLSADRRAAAVAPGYARGGVEFYEKILLRNQSLRQLLGPRGETTYSPNGNLFPNSVLQLRHTPYTQRRDLLLQLVQD